MKRAMFLCIFLVSVFCASYAWASSPILLGQVYFVGDQNEELLPAPDVIVKLEGRGDPTTTLSQGEFELLLPTISRKGKKVPLYSPGETIKLTVEKPDWIIHSPVDGETRHPDNLLKEVVEIRLLPKGSHKLWSHDRFRKEFQVLQDKTKEQINPQMDSPPEITFDQHIAKLAEKLGFSEDEVKGKLDEWAEEAEKADDPYDKALAEYYNKNFGEAKKLFQQSANLKLQELQQLQKVAEALQKKTIQVTEEAIVRFRRTGGAAYSAYDFKGALKAYEQALSIIPKDQLRNLWADVQMDIANANWAIGIRTKGRAVHDHLERSLAAHNGAESAYRTLEQREGVAAAQVGRGLIFSEQGTRTGGAEGQQLLAEAVTAYRAALKVYTQEQLPQDWAMTQNNLGTTLRDQGVRTGGEDGRQLLSEAVGAFKLALEVRTRESLAPQWAQTHGNLSEAALALEDWEQVVTSYRNVLAMYPDYAKAYTILNAVLHEHLFRYDKVYSLNKHWLSGHLDDVSGLSNFAEAHFTTGRFSEAEERLVSLLVNPQLDTQSQVALRIIEIGSLAAQNKDDVIPGKLQALRTFVESQPKEFKLGWSFEGTKHFIGQHEALVSSRNWLLGLIAGFEGKDKATMLAAVENARSNFVAAMGVNTK